MKIAAVRKLTRFKMLMMNMSQNKYAEHVGMTANNLYLFLAAKKAYEHTVPKAILDDLGLQENTLTTYTKVPK